MAEPELVVWYEAYDSGSWVRIDFSIDPNSLPKTNDSNSSKLNTFNLSFTDPLDNDGNAIVFGTGDNICITETADRYRIYEDTFAGRIKKMSCEIKSWKYESSVWLPVIEYKLTLQQRDFSNYPFELKIETATALSTVLDSIFIANTREDLGGILADGTQIPKYELMAEDININDIDEDRTAKENLGTALKSINYEWGIRYFVGPNGASLDLIQQVLIWLD